MAIKRICPKCKYENKETAKKCQKCDYIFYITDGDDYQESTTWKTFYKAIKSNLMGIINDETIKSYGKYFNFLLSRVADIRPVKTRRKRTLELKHQLFEPRRSRILYPYYYVKIFFTLALIFGFSVLLQNVPLTFLSLSLIVPFVGLWFFFELSKNVIQTSGFELLKAFVLGGLASVAFAILVYRYIDITEYNFEVFLLFALIEEFAKLLLCIFFIRKIKAINLITAILIGFAIGAGFSFLETSRFALYEYAGTNIEMDSIIVVLYRSLFNFFGIGHHYWTAIISGALVYFAYDNHPIQKRVSLLDILRPKFLFWFVIFISAHALFNYYETIYLRIGIGIMTLFVFYRFYITALFSRKIYCNPNGVI